jgi:hypothetical protein
METLRDFWKLAKEHASTAGLILTWLGIAAVYWRKRSEWQRKQFTNQVNFSLNYVVDNQLKLRTLLETSVQEVWLNDYGVKKVLAAAERTTAVQPFIVLADVEDMAFIQRAVLNVLSERFSEAFLAASMGLPVKKAVYCFALTYEKYQDMRTRKFRVLLMERESMKESFGSERPAEIAFAEGHHRDRWTTLKAMYELHGSPKNIGIVGEVELGIV